MEETKELMAAANRCLLLEGLLGKGKGASWRLVGRDRQEWRHRVGEATRPVAYAPND